MSKPQSNINKNQAGTSQEAKRKIFEKGTQSFRMHQWQTDKKMAKMNDSFKLYQPNLKEHEHLHYFRSHNQRGKKELRTTIQANHYHEVQLIEQGEGLQPLVQCGPPMHRKQKRLANGRTIEAWTPCEWEREDADGNRTVLKDQHTHDLEYMGFEDFTQQGIANIMRQNAREISNMFEGMASVRKDSIPPAMPEDMSMTEAPATIKEKHQGMMHQE